MTNNPFTEGFREGLRPFRAALPLALRGMLIVITIFLIGVGLIAAGTAVRPEVGFWINNFGGLVVLGGGVFGLVVTVRTWMAMFRECGAHLPWEK